MKLIIRPFLIFLFICGCGVPVSAGNYNLQSYGHFKKMMHMKKTDGVVTLKEVLPSANGYAVGAIQQGLGEITVIGDKVWLDYGKDGIGHSVNTIPADEKAVLLVTAQVPEWREYKISDDVTAAGLHQLILATARENGLDIESPFPFLVDGKFSHVLFHVINGRNPKPKAHGHGGLFIKLKEKRVDQQAVVVGFYSAKTQGVYTHPGESWHLHVVIQDENIGAHVDDISVLKGSILKLPAN